MTDGRGPSSIPTRRQFLGGLAGVGAGLLASGKAAFSQTPARNLRLVDVHHHFATPGWIKMLKDEGVLNNSWDGYSPAKTVELMDKAGIQTAFASQTTPGVWLVEGYGSNVRPKGGVKKHTNEESRVMVREMNEYGARMVSDFKGRFGIFAALAPPDVEGSLKEIEYALDTLKLHGVGILTSYGNHWLGDPKFTPVFEELNRRKAIVYTHPTAAPCCRDLIPDLGPTTIEYHTDTTRAVMSWISSGSAKRFPDITWIHSHGGGTLPILAGRLLGSDAQNLKQPAKPGSTLSYLRKYYYDTRHIDNWASSAAVKRLFGASQLMFGYFDIPRDEAFDGAKEFQKLVDTGEFTEPELRGIARENALKLFPQFA